MVRVININKQQQPKTRQQKTSGWQKFKQGASRFFKGAWNGIKKGARWVGNTIQNGLNFVKNNSEAINTVISIGSMIGKAVGG